LCLVVPAELLHSAWGVVLEAVPGGPSFLNADRIKRKLPSLLVDDSTTKKQNWNTLMRYRYRFTRFKKREPEKFNSITNRILSDLTDLEKAVNNSDDTGQRHHKAS